MSINNIFNICKDNLVLKSALSYVIKNNTGNSNPYHNFEHISNVFLFCKEGAEYHNLPESETLDLLVAALFHDFNHSGGKFDDDTNIYNAKMALDAWYNESDTSVNIDNIKSYIDITRFPYNVESSMLNLPQQILRDADMGSIFTDNWFQTIMLGLSSEINQDISDFLEAQINFMKNMKPNSEWFKNEKFNLLKNKIEDLMLYAEFI